MHILDDFFLLSWNEKADLIEKTDSEFSDKIYDIFIEDYEHFCDSSSLLLIVNSQNLEKIIEIEEFKLIFDGLFVKKAIDRCLILQIQKRVLVFLDEIGNKELNQTLKENFEILRKEGIITYYVSRRLIGLIALIKEHKAKEQKIELKTAKYDENHYKNSLHVLQAAIENLKMCVEQNYLKRLNAIDEKLKNERFSIGVTGVINAGKSTMLNALLKEEILGTSVIPETANLTILKYSKNRYAKVNFWNKKEFGKIENSAKQVERIKKFIDETKDNFKETLSEYIQEKSRFEEIKIEDLSLYTSAEKSSKKCNLVKSVELYSDLEFLKDGVQIVDTPGLDDPIIQREEITLGYISECDLMIHLMNVNQSATKKDVDFIIDSITYQNIARLLIVITRVDTVSSKELNEAIKYTKKSIELRLKEQNRAHNLNEIISKIEFIPLSGKMALYLRTGRQELAKKDGYDLEKSGILKLEEYLNKTLFGSNSQKANLIIKSNKGDILSIVEQTKSLVKEEKSLLGKSSLEIKQEYKRYKRSRDDLLSTLSNINSIINNQKRELEEYFKVLHKYSSEKLINLKDIVKVRVLDDVSYEMRKNRKIPNPKRIEYIVELGFKDGLVDLVREYKYQFSKKMQEAFEVIKNSYKEIESDKDDKFDLAEFTQRDFKSLIPFQNRSIEIAKINEQIKNHAKKSPTLLHDELDFILQKIIDSLEEMLGKKIEKTDSQLLKEFVDLSQKKVQLIEEEIKAKDEIIKTSMRRINGSAVDKQNRVAELEAKEIALTKIEKDLKALHDPA